MDTIRKKNTGRLAGTLYDEDEEPIDVNSIAEFKVTVYCLDDDKTVINGRTAVDLYNDGNWAAVNGMRAVVDSSGKFYLYLTKDDNIMVDADAESEMHAALIEVVTSGTYPTYLKKAIEFKVDYVEKVT